MKQSSIIGGMAILLFVSILFLSGCLSSTPTPTPTQFTEQNITEQNQQKLISKIPVPTLDDSAKRRNLVRKLLLQNEGDKVYYVYLVSYGKVMAFYTAKGEVTNLDSYLTNYQQIVKSADCYMHTSSSSDSGCWFAVEAPDLDGTYGSNGDGIFFFTTEGAYVEWKGEYMVSDYPLKLTTPPELVAQVNLTK